MPIPADPATALTHQWAPPDAAMGSVNVWVRDDGTVGLEPTGGPLLSVSLALFAQQHDGPRFIRVRDGLIVFAGHDRDGDPVELRYQAVGLRPAGPEYLAAQEGGYLLLERLP